MARQDCACVRKLGSNQVYYAVVLACWTSAAAGSVFGYHILLVSGGAVIPQGAYRSPSLPLLSPFQPRAHWGGRAETALLMQADPLYLMAVITCVMFCIWLYAPCQSLPPTQFLSESLSLSSLMHVVHTYTQTHRAAGPAWPACCQCIHKAKIATGARG